MDRELVERVDAYVDEVFDDVVADIERIVAVPSVADASKGEPGAPFGRDVRAALDCALDVARRLGYETGDDEGYVGWADIAGRDDRQLATIAHVDVVPAGPGWTGDPFQVRRREGYLIGRGVMDDKGPAILSLYAGAFLMRSGEVPRHPFRALIGCDEEVGMTDVHHYLASHEPPAFLFTPDATFPVCNAEKGCYGVTIRSGRIAGARICSWSGAEVTNAIPGESVLELAADISDVPAPAAGSADAECISIEEAAPGRVRLTARGIGGHASMPEGTLNAIGILVRYLAANPGLVSEDERRFIDLLGRVHADTDGAALGIASENDVFGALTVNGGTIRVADGAIEQTLDVRYPSSTTADAMTATLRELAAAHGASVEVTRVKEPFWVDASHPAVETLLDVYREVTGEQAEPFSMGGGTYARNFPCAVSFGPEPSDPDDPDWIGPMHGADEGASLAQLRLALKIYILAIMRLQEADL